MKLHVDCQSGQLCVLYRYTVELSICVFPIITLSVKVLSQTSRWHVCCFTTGFRTWGCLFVSWRNFGFYLKDRVTGTAVDKAKVLQNPAEIHLKGAWVVNALYSVLVRTLAGTCCPVFTVYVEIYASWTQLLVDMDSASSEVSWILPFYFLYFAARRFILDLSMQPGQSERGAHSTRGAKGQKTDPKPGRTPPAQPRCQVTHPSAPQNPSPTPKPNILTLPKRTRCRAQASGPLGGPWACTMRARTMQEDRWREKERRGPHISGPQTEGEAQHLDNGLERSTCLQATQPKSFPWCHCPLIHQHTCLIQSKQTTHKTKMWSPHAATTGSTLPQTAGNQESHRGPEPALGLGERQQESPKVINLSGGAWVTLDTLMV